MGESPEPTRAAATATPIGQPNGIHAFWRTLTASSARERQFLLNEVGQVRGLMPLLMKQRNRQRWTPEDKLELARHLKRLSRLSPYLVVVVMPGGFVMLPLLAWWLDRRRARNSAR